MRSLILILLVILAGCRASRHAVSETSTSSDDTTSVVSRMSISHLWLTDIDLNLDSPAIVLLTPRGRPGAVITARRATAAVHREDTVVAETEIKVDNASHHRLQEASIEESHAETPSFPFAGVLIAATGLLILYNVWRRRR